MTCKTCRFCFHRSIGGSLTVQNVCRRYPPTVFASGVNGAFQILSIPAVVNLEDWCGEYAPRSVVKEIAFRDHSPDA